MSKRVMIIFGAALLLLVIGIFLMKYELTHEEPEEDPEEDPEEEPGVETEKIEPEPDDIIIADGPEAIKD